MTLRIPSRSLRRRRSPPPLSVLSVSHGLGGEPGQSRAGRAAGRAVQHIFVIDLENEGYSATFGPGSPATYLNGTLRPEGCSSSTTTASGTTASTTTSPRSQASPPPSPPRLTAR